ncbi:hypothetical protein Pfo_020080 [Paulownia fortunei]|nr:hypothetical protein Pfo_020080 [Paulownia fortunei]
MIGKFGATGSAARISIGRTVKFKLKGHQKRATGLAFSNVLDVLVSSGADAQTSEDTNNSFVFEKTRPVLVFQLCVWSLDEWEKKANSILRICSFWRETEGKRGGGASTSTSFVASAPVPSSRILAFQWIYGIQESWHALVQFKKMSLSDKDLTFLILQFLDEEKFKETIHKLEAESGFYFNMRYFEDAVTNGEWEDVEKYLSGFTKVDDNPYSTKIFFLIQKQKYLEALDKGDGAKAVEILAKDLKVFSTSHEDLYKEMAMLLTLDNFRDNSQLSWYSDTKSARARILLDLKEEIVENPLLSDKLQFPNLTKSILRTLMNQSLSLEHQLCENPKPNPDSRSLFSDHSCGQPSGSNPFSARPMCLSPPNNADSEHVSKRSRPVGVEEKVNSPLVVYPGQSHARSLNSFDDLPKTVVANYNQVGTNCGDISLWDLVWAKRISLRNVKVWDLGSCTLALQDSLAKENTASVNRVMWSPHGCLLGVAHSKHIVHLYRYDGKDLRNHLEIDAHVGNVSDLAFSHPKGRLCVITCGEDKTIKVWDAATGDKQHTFEGHDAPVYSVCPHYKEGISFILSAAVNGKIKAWLYDNMGSRLDYVAPGHSPISMAYSADGTRLFSCGTNKDGESFIVEWNESERTVKRMYLGLGTRSVGVVKFDTTKNRFLAAGDEFAIKYWDMDKINLWSTIDADGGLEASPCIRFSKGGLFLAVSTSENGVKVLANGATIRMMRFIESRVGTALKGPMTIPFGAAGSAPMISNGADRNNGRNLPDLKPNSEGLKKSKLWQPTEISEQSQLRSLRIPDGSMSSRITRLVYTHFGGGILAVADDAVHRVWVWEMNKNTNATGKATTAVPPHSLLPFSKGTVLFNNIRMTNLEEAVPCFAVSKNDILIVSALEGKISLYDRLSYEMRKSCIPTPFVATFLAFHPRNKNVIAVGTKDSSIQIYDLCLFEVKFILRGHQKRVTSLAFSNVLDVLVSSGADAQLCVWRLKTWKKKASKFLQIPPGRTPNLVSQTRIQFHQDQIHVLVVHETQIAIYKASKLECIKQWVPQESSAALTDATYSCDSQSIYATFEDGSVCVFTSPGLKLRCRINPTAYLPPCGPSLSSRVYPSVIVAHPDKANQFALGLSDGGVHVVEPLETEEMWGVASPEEHGAGPSASPVASAPDQ